MSFDRESATRLELNLFPKCSFPSAILTKSLPINCRLLGSIFLVNCTKLGTKFLLLVCFTFGVISFWLFIRFILFCMVSMLGVVIVAAFEKYGTVTDVHNPSKGCAVVTFSNPSEAKAAMEALEVTELGGCLVTVSAARSFDSKLRKSSHNVSKEIAYSELWDAVKIHGPVARLKYKLSEQFAFVSFKSSEDAHKAIYAIHGKELCGRKVQCNAGVPSGDGVGFRLKFLDS